MYVGTEQHNETAQMRSCEDPSDLQSPMTIIRLESRQTNRGGRVQPPDLTLTSNN